MFGSKDNKPPSPPSDPLKTPDSKQVQMAAAPKIGLALGSGLARGFAHIGVVRALKRHGIVPTIISGTSMGALSGGAHLALKLDNVEELAYSLNRSKVMSYLDFSRGIISGGGGMIGGEKLVKLMLDAWWGCRGRLCS